MRTIGRAVLEFSRPAPSDHTFQGLHDEGIDERHVVSIQAATSAERLWSTLQLIRSNAAGIVVACLPQARQEQFRPRQTCALGCDCPVFHCRPASAAVESTAAPLRLQVRYGVAREFAGADN